MDCAMACKRHKKRGRISKDHERLGLLTKPKSFSTLTAPVSGRSHQGGKHERSTHTLFAWAWVPWKAVTFVYSINDFLVPDGLKITRTTDGSVGSD